MVRQPRIIVEGMPHHVVQRGNYRQNVFENQADYRCYSYWAAFYANKYDIDILAYCLMTNHVHLILVPQNKENLSLFINTIHMRYSQYKNKKSNRKGHLWQGRFYSSVLDEGHLIRAIRYVEQNPLRARMVKEAKDYIWSSLRFHLGLGKDPIIKTKAIALMPNRECWAEYIKIEDNEVNSDIRIKTFKGGVLASQEFISSIEDKFGIILQPKKRGRPFKK